MSSDLLRPVRSCTSCALLKHGLCKGKDKPCMQHTPTKYKP